MEHQRKPHAVAPGAGSLSSENTVHYSAAVHVYACLSLVRRVLLCAVLA